MRSFSSVRPPAKKTRASILVHGLTGKGKTTRALRGGKPLVICTEPKAEAHILMLNPQATCWIPESCEDLEQIFQWLGDSKLLEQGFTRIVLDSYTELTEMLPNWILRKQAADAKLELGRRIDIGEYRPLQEWGIALIRSIQLSGLPSIIIARSDAKKIGLVEMVVPAGLGSSARNLNAQLVPTVEARWDTEMQEFIWDSRPDEYSQRCGLLWVPAVFRGTADEFLDLVEKGEHLPQDVATPPAPPSSHSMPAPPAARPATADAPSVATAPVQPASQPIAPPAHQAEYETAVEDLNQMLYKAPGWTSDERTKVVQGWLAQGHEALPRLRQYMATIQQGEPQTIGAVLAQLPPLQPDPGTSQESEDFVDQIADGKDSPTFVPLEVVRDLPGILANAHIDLGAFLRYCAAERHLVLDSKGEARIQRIVLKAWEKLAPILASERRAGSLAAFIKSKYPNPSNAA